VLRTELLGRALEAPLFVSGHDGRDRGGRAVNARLARAAAEHGIALTLGSGRPLLDDPELLRTYRSAARPPLLLANLGVAQLRAAPPPGSWTSSARRPERAPQPRAGGGPARGHPRLRRRGERIAAAVAALHPLPVVVKEVGFGMDPEDVALLRDAGVAAIDVAGAGGTNWATIEGRRDPRAAEVADAFADWGVPTVDALRAPWPRPRPAVIASGGIADGVAGGEGPALGATPRGSPGPFLLAAQADRAGEAGGRRRAPAADRHLGRGAGPAPSSARSTWPHEPHRRHRRGPRRASARPAPAGHGPRRHRGEQRATPAAARRRSRTAAHGDTGPVARRRCRGSWRRSSPRRPGLPPRGHAARARSLLPDQWTGEERHLDFVRDQEAMAAEIARFSPRTPRPSPATWPR
jgi:isopentenyl-diphosphate delta-isomerase